MSLKRKRGADDFVPLGGPNGHGLENGARAVHSGRELKTALETSQRPSEQAYPLSRSS